jgi:hypothetical protein
VIYLQLRVQMPNDALILARFVRQVEQWRDDEVLESREAIAMAVVLEATGLTRQAVHCAFAQLHVEIPYRQIDKQSWHMEGLWEEEP